MKRDLLDRIACSRKVANSAAKSIDINPTGRFESFPMTDMQQAYWIGREDAAAMHIYLEYEVDNLDFARFHRAWDMLLHRHDMLRVIARPDGYQQVLEVVPEYTIDRHSLLKLDISSRDRMIEATRRDLAHKHFDLAVWPQFEIRVLDEENKSRIAFSIDTWCIDGRSIQVLFAELNCLYLHPETELAPLELTFRDYVLWSRQQEQGDAYESELAYWRERVADLAGPPALPVRSELALELGHFERQAHQFNAQQTQQLRELAQSLGMTVNGLLLGTYAEVLGRWSSTPRFTLNIPRFNRPQVHEQINSVMGEFATFSLLSVDRQQGATLGDRLKRIQEDLWQALDHSRVSGVRLLREISRLNGRVETMAMPIVFTSAADGFTLERFGSLTREITQTPQVWLDCQYYFVSDGLYVNWDYVASRFHPGVIEQMFTAWCVLLQGLCVPQRCEALLQSQQAVDLPDEQKAVRAKLNDQRQAYDSRPVYRQFVENMDKRADDDQLVAVCGSERLTYGQLHAQSAQLGSYLQLLNDSSLKNDGKVQPLIGVLLPKGVQQLVAVYGVLASGAAYLPLDLAQPQARLDSILRDAGVNQVLVDAQTQSQVSPEFETLRIDEWQAGYCHSTVLADEQLAGWQTTGQDLVYVMYTSGSTGQPKGVQIEQAGVLNALDQSAKRFVFSYPVRALGLTALHHDMSVYDVLGVPLSGGLLVLPEQAKRTDPQCWSELVHEYALNCWVSVPAAVEMLLSWGQVSNWRYESLRTVLVGGDWVAGRLYERLMLAAPQARLYSVGGPTETTMWNISAPVGPLSDEWRSVPYGVPLPNCGYRILDERMQACPDWVTGEMYCSGISLARGYVNDVALTAERFVFDVQTGERLYLTQDLGYYHPDGQIEFVGRADGQLKVRGNRIESGEVQSVLEGWPQVRRALVYVYELRLAAALVLQPGEQPQSRERLHEQAAAQLPSAMVPGVWLQLDQLPLTGHGKVDMEELRDLTAKQLRTQHPQSRELREGERELGQLWEQLLGVQVNSAQDNFFMLGGDSLLAVRLIALVKQRLGRTLSLPDLFSKPTLEAQAALLDTVAASVIASIPTLQLSEGPLSHSQEDIWLAEVLSEGRMDFHVCYGCRLSNKPDLACLRTALQRMIERHRPLRMVFEYRQAELVQYDFAQAYEPLVVEHCSDAQAFGQALARAEQDELDLTRQPGWCVHYLTWPTATTQTNDAHAGILVFHFHHAIFDGWSASVFMEELGQCYESAMKGQPVSLKSLPIDYIDYAVWNREQVRMHRQTDLAFWERELTDANDFDWPVLRKASGEKATVLPQAAKPAVLSRRLDYSLHKDIAKLSETMGITTFVIYLAAWQVVLKSYSGQQNFLIGTYDAGRIEPETYGLIGSFVNNVIIRTELDSRQIVTDFLRTVHQRKLAAFAHLRLPFSQLVKELGGSGLLNERHPLYQVGFVMQAESLSEVQSGALEWTPFPLNRLQSRMEAELMVTPEGGHILLDLNYNKMVLPTDDAERLLETYGAILQAIVSKPGQALEELQKRVWPDETTMRDSTETTSSDEFGLSQLVAETIFRPDDRMDQLAAIWETLLGVKPAATDNFFMLGGDSLLAVRLVVLIRERLGVDVRIGQVLTHPVLALMAQCISQQDGGVLLGYWEQVYERSDPIPLSFAQRRLWMLSQLDPHGTQYLIPLRFTLHGPLQRSRFEASFVELIERHTILRSYIVQDKSGQACVELVDEAVQLAYEDLQGFNDPERQQRLDQRLRDQASTTLDLGCHVPYRAGLIRLSSQEHVFYLTVHHAVLDGVATEVLVQELMALYAGQSLAPVEHDYVRYSRWEQSEAFAQQIEPGLSYWSRRLSDLQPLALPYMDIHASDETSGLYAQQLSEGERQELQKLARDHGVTAFTVYALGLQLVLGRLRQGGDVAFGTYAANRVYAPFSHTVGTFVNPLVLRFKYDEGESLSQALERTQLQVMQDFEWQHVPFERVVEQLNPPREPGRHPLFEVGLVCNEQLYQAQYEVQGLRLQPQGLDGREGVTHRTALEVWISPQSEGLEVVATYAQARVGDRLAQAVIQGLCEVLRQMLCVEPARQLGQIGWQTAQVAKQADVSVWQGDRQEWPAGTLWSLWQQQVKRQGPAVAVYGDEDQADVSWQQLSDGAEALAVHLVQQGVCAGEVVAVLLEHSPQLVQAVLGVVRSGAVLLLLEPGDPSQRHVELVADAGVRWIISNEVDEAQAAGLEQQNWVALPEEEPQLQALLAEREVLSGRVESEVLYWVYTSGSTGQPKAVQGSVRGFINRLYWMGRQYGVQAGERALLKTSVSFVDIYGELLGNLLEGVALVVASDARRRDPAGLLWRLREGQVDRLTVTPSLLQALCEQLDQDGVAGQAVAPLSLRLVFSSGEALSWSLVRQARASLGSGLRLVNVYGSSEVSADVAAYEVGHEEQEDASVVSGLVPVGQLMSNVKARIVGQEGLVQWPGLVGRLQLGGVALSPGYAGKARRAESMFYENEGERWFDTGDEVIRNARGELIVLGRRDAQVKLRGIRIDLQGLDVQVAGVAGVRQSLSAVIDTGGGPVLGVLVVVQGGATQQAVRVALQQQLPAPMVPGIIEVVQQLPRLSTGKPDRGQAAALLQQALQCEQDEQQALTPLQQRIEQIWRTLLQREQPIGAHQNFFTLGGHSLMLARLASRLRIEFKADVSMGELMNATTIASQSAQVEKNISNTADILPLVERPTVFPLSENQLGLWTYQQSRPDAASYNMTFVLRMHGCLNLQQFSVALNLLVKRHEALRYRFVEQRNEAGLVEPALKIEPDVWLMPEYRRISGDLQEESEIEAARLSAQPFDLEQGPLLRVSLLQAEQDSYACVLSMHHIIADGWSVGVLLQDLAILYEGRAPDEMAFQLVDYEAWRRSWLGDVERQQRLASFWHDYLAQLPGRLEFSILPDLPDGVSVYESATLVQTLDKQWATVLPEICRQRSNEIYDVVLAAFSLALHELTKRQDLVIGTVLAARHLHPELEKMVGFLANTVPVRTAVDDTMPLQVFFDGVVERRRQALQHQDIPFGALQNLQRGSDPLIEVLCIHQNVPYAGFSLPGVQCEVESVQVGETKFPLNLQTLHDGEKLVVHFEYARAYFAESTIMRMLATMQRFLRIYCDTLLEHKTVGDLLLAPYALTRGGAIRLPESRPRNLPQALARTVEKYPDHGITIIDEQGTEVLTYARLDRLARDYAGRLNRAGVNEGDPVILVAGGIRHYLITLWGAILLGAIPVTVAAPIGMDAQACLDKLEATWETLAHPLVIAPACDPKVWRVLLRECPGFRIVDPRQLGEAPPVTLADPQPETTAFFQLTAGSTGRSKCIEERHEAVLAYMEMTSQARNYDADQRTLNWLPFDHIVPILTFHLRDIYLGRDQVHVDTGYILQQPLRWMQLMSDLKVTHGWAPNFAFHLAVQALDAVDSDSSVDLGHVRELLNAGEMVTQATQDAFRRSAGRFGLAPEGLVASFGMAECCTCITYATPQEHEVRSDSLSLAGNGMQVGASSFASLGKVIPGMDIRIIDDNCQLLREYQVGKFQLKGLSLMRGYHNAREINDSAYTHDGWFDTGDNGFIANGCLYLTGREKEVLIVNGINYFCFDLEEKVQSVTGIMPTYVAALSWRDVDQEAVAICYVPVEGTTSTRAIDDRIRDILVRETGLVPKKIVALARHGFQKTTSGKIQRVQMAQKLLQNALPRYQDSGQAVPLRQAYWQTWTPPKQPDEMQYADIVVWEADASFDMQQLPGCLRDLSRQFAATSGVHSPTPTRLLRVMLSEKPQGHYWGLFGLLNSYCAENPGWKVQMIQRSSAADAASEWPVQAGWFRQTTEGWACLTLGEAAAVQITATQPQNVLITGGGGALAWLLAQDYVERGATVWLLGRSDAPPWLDDGQPQAQMHWIRDDLSMVRQTSQRLEEALPEGTTFDVICHLAGTMETGLSSQLEDNALIRTMRAKVEGLEVLRKALKMSQKSAPAQWVLYGSVVAACGFPLSGAYAYANGALLDMAHSMRAEGEQVCWLGWSAWRGVGMSRNGLDAGQLASHGLHLLEPEQARLHHWRLAGTNDDFFIGIEGLAALPGVTVSPSLGDKSPILSISECRERIENALKAVLSLEKVQADDHFFDLGATSISLVQIQRHLRERGQITLDVAVLLQYPTVTRLTQYMAQGESDMQTVTLSARKSDVRRRRTARSSVKTPKRGQ
ncbi:amino acid adenylation domain-containing protein [Halomonas sp. AOP42-A1-22]|uniref:amino acid adenylation domain-containing protein n=1 Tax=Halomonas sp. AOP42-A1-22 TaxID=3457674 RepID=UPI0040344B10